MAKFYNPYHWVPTEKPNDAQRHLGVSRADFGKGKPDQVTHERFVPATNSGRLVVKLTTVTPTVIGAQQSREGKMVAQVTPYMVGGSVI